MAERVIASLAVLKVNWDAGRDYIDNFVPFVVECIRTARDPEVSLPELQTDILSTFGLRIPQTALKTILKRAFKAGYLKRSEGIYIRDDSAVEKINVAAARDVALRRHEALVRKLIDFCETKYRVKWSQEEAEVALLSYLEEHSVPILAAAVEGELVIVPPASVKHAEFLVNAFIADVHTADPEGFDFLETVVKGRMLADVLLYPEIGMVHKKFEAVQVYLDTPFILRALGLAGKNMETPCLEFVNLLYEENARLMVFEHTRDEIHGILDVAIKALRSKGFIDHAFGETLQFFIDSKYQASDVEFTIARLEESFRRLHIHVRTKPAHTAPLGLNETSLQSWLQGSVGYRRQEALYHDLDCLTAIHRLRRGQLFRSIENCRAVFVTTNSALARTSAAFFRDEFRNMIGAVPHCVLDDVLATLVWLKRPLKMPDLPRKRIIADCYAALNPPDALWRMHLKEMDHLRQEGRITEDDYQLLRHSMDARRALMDITFGDPDTFTEGTVPEVLERAKAAARADAQEALKTERVARLDAEQRATVAEAAAEAHIRAQFNRLRDIGAAIGRWAARTASVLAVACLGLGVYLTLPSPFPPPTGAKMKLLAPALLLILAILTVAHLFMGTTVISITRRFELYVSRIVTTGLCKLVGQRVVPPDSRQDNEI